MQSITVSELKNWLSESKDFQLIDVREESEFAEVHMDGELIPMNTIPDNVDRISKEMPVVVHCKAGVRSANVIQYLEQKHGFENLYNLEGGIMAWLAK